MWQGLLNMYLQSPLLLLLLEARAQAAPCPASLLRRLLRLSDSAGVVRRMHLQTACRSWRRAITCYAGSASDLYNNSSCSSQRTLCVQHAPAADLLLSETWRCCCLLEPLRPSSPLLWLTSSRDWQRASGASNALQCYSLLALAAMVKASAQLQQQLLLLLPIAATLAQWQSCKLSTCSPVAVDAQHAACAVRALQQQQLHPAHTHAPTAIWQCCCSC
jgi:hypothetical protein